MVDHKLRIARTGARDRADALASQPAANTISSTPLCITSKTIRRHPSATGTRTTPTKSSTEKDPIRRRRESRRTAKTYTIAYGGQLDANLRCAVPRWFEERPLLRTKRLRPDCYGTSSECNDPDNDGKGDHAYPYANFVWVLRRNDLASAKNGETKNPEVLPHNG